MCLAAPARVLRVEGDDATVDLDGVQLVVSKALTPDLAAGDLALIHVGFVLARIDEAQAEETLNALRRGAVEMAS
jgi:hydrogenase expression/formation protein HypC